MSFIEGMKKKPRQVRIVHGDDEAKAALREKVVGLAKREGFECEVVVPG